MDGDGKRSKGGFFHLFDWNGKSRKKLFSNDSGLLAKEGKENAQNSGKSSFYKVDDKREKSSNKGSSEFSCSSSVTSDEGGYGVRAPGLVARLMGLDSLPTSNIVEPSSSPFSDSSSLKATQHGRSTPRLLSEYNPMDYLRIPHNQEMYSWNYAESRPHKVQSLPIERFQTEILPPKSAKPIPVSHNKLLSPIRNPGFSPRKDVAYIIEATAKIIDASPKATSNAKVPSIGSSSVPLRIRNLKQKMEAANTSCRPQRPNQHSTAKTVKGQLSDKGQGALESMSSHEASICPEKGTSSSSRNKGNLFSVAVQAKANMQRRESSSTSDSSKKQKEKIDAKSNLLPKSHPGRETTIQKRTAESRTSNVLRQNNQKQNSVANKESSVSKNLVSNQQCRKPHSVSGSVRPSRTVNKVVIKAESVPRESVMGDYVDKEKTIVVPRKKRPVNGVLHTESSVSDRPSFDKVNGPVKCNVERDECMNPAVVDGKNGVDVVSFTFTSPMTKAMPGVQSPGQTSNSSGIDSCGSGDPFHSKESMSSFRGLNVIGGDALGALLEQKLRELTNKVKLANCNIIREETSSSASISENSFPTLNSVSSEHAAQDTMFQFVIDRDKSDHPDDSGCFSAEGQQKWQLLGEMEVQSDETDELNSCSNYSESGKELEHLDPSPVSILELPLMTGSCTDATGSKYYPPAGVAEANNPKSTNGSLAAELETELSDSSSSMATVDVERENAARALAKTKFKEHNSWELEYVKEILNNTELTLEDFTLCQTPAFVTPDLFDLMENYENGMERNEEEASKLGRKVLFDCVSEHLDFIWGQICAGTCKTWAKFCILFERKGWLAEQLYREILSWKSMGDLMVDELVDKDMSSQYGRWLDFDVEAFEEGVEIEREILTSIVDELVSDLLS